MDGLDFPSTVLPGKHHQLRTLRVDFTVSNSALRNACRVSPGDIAQKADLDLASFPRHCLRKAHISRKMPRAIALLVFDATALENYYVWSKMTELVTESPAANAA